jgi:hypothetical protein
VKGIPCNLPKDCTRRKALKRNLCWKKESVNIW